MKVSSKSDMRSGGGEIATWVAAFLNVFASGGFILLINRPSWETPGSGPNPALLIVYFLALGSMGFILVASWNRSRLLKDGTLLFLVGILPLVSAIWAPVLLGTVREALHFASVYFVAVATAVYFSPNSIIKVAFRAAIITVIASFVMVLLFPEVGTHSLPEDPYQGAWRGILDHKNEFGIAMGISLLLFLTTQRGELRSGMIRLPLILSAATGLVFSRSASAVFMTFGTTIFFGAVTRFFPPLVTTALRISILPAVLLGLYLVAFPVDSLSRDATLTGRVPFWGYLLSHLNHPLLIGLGYSTGYQVYLAPDIVQIFGPSFPNSHNGFLDLYIGLGLLGLSMFLSLIILAFISAAALARSAETDSRLLGKIAIMVLTLTILTNFTEATFTVPGIVLDSAILFAAAVILKQEKVNKYRNRVESGRQSFRVNL